MFHTYIFDNLHDANHGVVGLLLSTATLTLKTQVKEFFIVYFYLQYRTDHLHERHFKQFEYYCYFKKSDEWWFWCNIYQERNNTRILKLENEIEKKRIGPNSIVDFMG